MGKNCLYCGKDLEFQRSTKKYCNDNCKQLAYYKRQAEALSGIPAENPHVCVKEEVTVKESLTVKQDDFTVNNKDENIIPAMEQRSPSTENENTTTQEVSVKQEEKILSVKNTSAKEEPYEWEESNFVEAIRAEIHGDDEEIIFSSPEKYWAGDTLKVVQWVTMVMRCLIESIIQLSNRKYIDEHTLFEIADAFNRLIGSYSYDFLPKNYPYMNLIKELQPKMNAVAHSNKGKEKICFRLSPERKAKLIAVRFLIANFVPKIKFSELELPIIKEKHKL